MKQVKFSMPKDEPVDSLAEMCSMHNATVAHLQINDPEGVIEVTLNVANSDAAGIAADCNGEVIEEDPKAVKRFGYTFKPMTSDDWDGWAGADEGTLIYNSPDGEMTLLLAPSGLLSEVHHTLKDNDVTFTQHDWRATRIN